MKPRLQRRAIALALLALAALGVAPAPASAITRDTVLARGKVWVDRFVPYSQRAYANEAGALVSGSSLGWRTDCSGFASYCLGLRYSDGRPLSYDSGTILRVLTPITKEDLKPGDIIDRPNNLGYSYGHAIVFVAWADEAHTQYWSYEQSSSRGGAVTRLVEYPFWGEPGFKPYRYNGIEEDYDAWIERVAGTSRYGTAVEASKRAFESGSADTVVVCSGLDWPDALGGAALAGAVDGPVLLTDPEGLSTCVPAELERLGATRAIVIGGEGAVSSDVASALAGAGLERVDRIGGADRYETAAMVASATAGELRARGGRLDGTVYLASGENFPDALAVSPVAARFARPVLLTRASELPSVTSDALTALEPTRVAVLGGEAAVGSEAASAACEGRTQLRLAGPDRYATSVQIARHGVSEGMWWFGAGVTSGTSFADALAGGASQGALGSPMLLTHPKALAPATAQEITANAADIGRVRCYGGLAAVSGPVRTAIARCLGM